ncbi:hypothetical protein PLESTF_001706000 [Pleodorina starrii]|nr:hypothetical protein PLESTF_001706000 [Pleodorina starrii]
MTVLGGASAGVGHLPGDTSGLEGRGGKAAGREQQPRGRESGFPAGNGAGSEVLVAQNVARNFAVEATKAAAEGAHNPGDFGRARRPVTGLGPRRGAGWWAGGARGEQRGGLGLGRRG